MRNEIGLRRSGDEVILDIIRENKSKIIKAKIGKGSDSSSFLKAKNKWDDKLDGAQFANTNNNIGVRVVQIAPGSAAIHSGLRQGDLIVEVNKKKISTLDDFKKVLAEADSGLLLRIERGEGALFVAIR